MSRPTTAGASDRLLGLVRAAGLDLALPLTALREVVPAPAELDALPATARGLLGVMTLRGAPVPVVDLATVAGRPAVRRDGQVVVVVAHAGRVLGLLVDEVRGMASIADEDRSPVAAAAAELLFRETFLDPGSGRVVTVLEPDALVALPGVPVMTGAAATVQDGTRPAALGDAVALTVVRCGPHLLALEVAHVHSTVPHPEPAPFAAAGGVCLGVTPVGGDDVAVADTLGLLGLGVLEGELRCGVVLDLPVGRVVLGVSDLVGLVEVAAADVVALPAEAAAVPHLLTRVATVPGTGAVLVVDGARLRAEPLVTAMGRLATPSPGAGAAVGGSAAVPTARRDAEPAAVGGVAHLEHEAGVRLATPLDQVAEVLGWPEELLRSGGATGVLGVVVHRGTAVPVLDLALLLGRPAPAHGAASRLLLLEVDGRHVAYAVTALRAITPLVWTDPAPRAARGDVLRDCPLGQLAGDDALVPVLDLVTLTRRLRAAADATGAAAVAA